MVVKKKQVRLPSRSGAVLVPPIPVHRAGLVVRRHLMHPARLHHLAVVRRARARVGRTRGVGRLQRRLESSTLVLAPRVGKGQPGRRVVCGATRLLDENRGRLQVTARLFYRRHLRRVWVCVGGGLLTHPKKKPACQGTTTDPHAVRVQSDTPWRQGETTESRQGRVGQVPFLTQAPHTLPSTSRCDAVRLCKQ